MVKSGHSQPSVDWKNVGGNTNYETPFLNCQFQILSKCIELFPELFNSALPAPDNDLAVSCNPLTELPAPDWSQRSSTLELSPDAPSPPVHQTPPPPSSSYPLIAAPPSQPAGPPPSSDVPLSPDKLNYQAIHEELEGHSVRGKLLLLQALRWVNQKRIKIAGKN